MLSVLALLPGLGCFGCSCLTDYLFGGLLHENTDLSCWVSYDLKDSF